jgi:hypothetical protein
VTTKRSYTQLLLSITLHNILHKDQCKSTGAKAAHKMLVKLTTGVNFTNILHKAFTRSDPKSAKETDSLTLFFAQLGSARAKAALKMLVISTLDVAMGLLP